jgi:hypothetical protein
MLVDASLYVFGRYVGRGGEEFGKGGFDDVEEFFAGDTVELSGRNQC